MPKLPNDTSLSFKQSETERAETTGGCSIFFFLIQMVVIILSRFIGSIACSNMYVESPFFFYLLWVIILKGKLYKILGANPKKDKVSLPKSK